jgi:hypothetical protein
LVLILAGTPGCRKRTIEPVVPTGDRVVLLEEFTGKGCTNCPKGSREIENLRSIWGGQLSVVSIHANFFADPQFFPLGQYDLRTDEGEQLFDLLGPNLGYPAGVINRTKFNGEYQHAANVWGGYIAQEIEADPEIEFTIMHEYDPGTRLLQMIVSGRAKVAVTTPIRISVMITESGIVDAQDDAEAGGIVEDYIHNHVLRDMLTPFDGQDLADALAEGEEFEEEFTDFTIPTEWVDSECTIIVFISRNAGSGNITVLQAGEIHLTE